MMGIFDYVSETIKRYGCNVSIENKGFCVKTKAFVEPLRYKNRVYVGGEYHHLGFRKTEKYLYVGCPENKLEANSCVIEMQNNKYIVKRCETYYVKDNPIYVWAILESYGELLEDDYESI